MATDLIPQPVEETVDHLLLGVGDLDRGIEWVEKLTGVKAVYGGRHPGLGTKNALLSLGGWRYLEIIAPDPAQPAFRFRIDLPSLAAPRLISWAASTQNPDSIRKIGQQEGYRIVGPDEGSRARPDGRVLRWTTVGLRTPFDRSGIEVVPFFIRWVEDSRHPSQDSPQGCTLASFHIIHPEAAGLDRALTRFGIQMRVRRGEQAALSAILETPKGRVEIT
ncbi:MAG: VOC family protein [Acidobacteria bacterium]|nr:MAG: VOC family protein [Acidobacteriota bacterium]